MNDLKTIFSSADLQEAYYIKSLLESEGIKTCILDENISTVAPHFTFAQGIRLAVNEINVAAAQKLIKNLKNK